MLVVLVVNTAPGSRGLRHPEHGQPWVLPSTCPLLAPCCCGAWDLLPPMLPGLGGLSTDLNRGGSTRCSVRGRGTLSGSCIGSFGISLPKSQPPLAGKGTQTGANSAQMVTAAPPAPQSSDTHVPL